MRIYIVIFIIRAVKKYLLWYSDENDGFLCENGNIASFDNEADCLKIIKIKGLVFEKEYTAYDLDRIAVWLQAPNEQIECNFFIDVWNMFSDLCFSLGIDFIGDKSDVNSVYNKLFWGCNLPSIIKKGEKFQPHWTINEIEILKSVYLKGIDVFSNAIKTEG